MPAQRSRRTTVRICAQPCARTRSNPQPCPFFRPNQSLSLRSKSSCNGSHDPILEKSLSQALPPISVDGNRRTCFWGSRGPGWPGSPLLSHGTQRVEFLLVAAGLSRLGPGRGLEQARPRGAGGVPVWTAPACCLTRPQLLPGPSRPPLHKAQDGGLPKR